MALVHGFRRIESELAMFLSRSGTNPRPAGVEPRSLSPTRFVLRNKLNRDDKPLLAFDARVCRKCLGERSASARSCMGRTMRP